MLAGIHLVLVEFFAGVDLRQASVLVVVLAFVALFALIHVGAEEAVEPDDRADRAQTGFLTLAIRQDFDRCSLNLGRCHLAGNAALPDQLVETRLVRVEVATHLLRGAVEVSGSDRFVSFLGVLRLGGIEAGLLRDVAIAKLLLDSAPRAVDRLRCHLYAVGTHIGNETDRLAADVYALIELLCHLHRSRGIEAEIGGGGLLQGGCGEGRTGIALDRLCLDALDHVARAFEQGLEAMGVVSGLDRAVLQPLAVGGDQSSLELIAPRGAEQCGDIPVLFRNEAFDFGFAVADEAEGDGLHPARRAGARQLAPKDRRQVEADKVVEGAAGEIGVHQRGIDIPRRGHGVKDRLLGDGVEDDALDGLVPQHAPLLEKIENVPGNGLAFPIRVGREEQAVGSLNRVGNVLDALL